MSATGPAALQGVRVLDFGRYIAGPYCACLLGHLGADVIRVESLDGGEDRSLAPLAAEGDGALFHQSNVNKRAIAVDTESAAGTEIMRQLIARADVVVANMPEPALRRRGLDYQALTGIRPSIILTAITGFGTTGPKRDHVSFDGIAQAMTGAMYLSGVAGRPMKSCVPYVDYGTAVAAALGTLAALMTRDRTGYGQQVDISLFATAITFANNFLVEQAVLSKNRVGTGNRSQLYGPSDVFPTIDGFIFVQVIGRSTFERWARLVGEEGWLEDARFETNEARGIHASVLADRMTQWCAERSTDAALDELDRARIPAAPVLSPQQCLDHVQFRAMDPFTLTEIPAITSPVPVATWPVRLARGGVTVTHRAPAIGEHTDSILDELGYSASAIAELHDRSVVACRLPQGVRV